MTGRFACRGRACLTAGAIRGRFRGITRPPGRRVNETIDAMDFARLIDRSSRHEGRGNS